MLRSGCQVGNALRLMLSLPAQSVAVAPQHSHSSRARQVKCWLVHPRGSPWGFCTHAVCGRCWAGLSRGFLCLLHQM